MSYAKDILLAILLIAPVMLVSFSVINYNAYAQPTEITDVNATARLANVLVEWSHNQINTTDYFIDRGTGFNLTSLVHNQNFNLAENDSPEDVSFSPNGLKMYMLGDGDPVPNKDEVYEYDLTNAFDISTASFLQKITLYPETISPQGMFLKPDGTKLYITANANSTVAQYDFSTPYDITTITLEKSFPLAAAASGVQFSTSGFKFYITVQSVDQIREYTMGTAWEVDTATLTDTHYIGATTTVPRDLLFSLDGRNIIVLDTSPVDQFDQYTLTQPFNVSTANFDTSEAITAFELQPEGIFIKTDNTKLYVAGGDGDEINEFNMTLNFNTIVPSVLAANGNITTTAYLDTTVDLGTSYLYSVTPTNTTSGLNGTGILSNEVLTNNVPSQVTGLTALYIDQNTISLDWEDTNDLGEGLPANPNMTLTEYIIYDQDLGISPFVQSGTSATSDFNFAETFPQEKEFKVQACNEVGCGTNSTIAQSMIVNATTPNPVTNFTAVANVADVDLSWVNGANTTDHTIERSSDFLTDDFSGYPDNATADLTWHKVKAGTGSADDIIGVNATNDDLRFFTNVATQSRVFTDLSLLKGSDITDGSGNGDFILRWTHALIQHEGALTSSGAMHVTISDDNSTAFSGSGQEALSAGFFQQDTGFINQGAIYAANGGTMILQSVDTTCGDGSLTFPDSSPNDSIADTVITVYNEFSKTDNTFRYRSGTASDFTGLGCDTSFIAGDTYENLKYLKLTRQGSGSNTNDYDWRFDNFGMTDTLFTQITSSTLVPAPDFFDDFSTDKGWISKSPSNIFLDTSLGFINFSDIENSGDSKISLDLESQIGNIDETKFSIRSEYVVEDQDFTFLVYNTIIGISEFDALTMATDCESNDSVDEDKYCLHHYDRNDHWRLGTHNNTGFINQNLGALPATVNTLGVKVYPELVVADNKIRVTIYDDPNYSIIHDSGGVTSTSSLDISKEAIDLKYLWFGEARDSGLTTGFGASGYYDSISFWNGINITESSGSLATTWKDTGVDLGTVYQYRITPINNPPSEFQANGTATLSNSVLTNDVPDQIENLVSDYTGSHTIFSDWDSLASDSGSGAPLGTGVTLQNHRIYIQDLGGSPFTLSGVGTTASDFTWCKLSRRKGNKSSSV
jgi:hypothetical protein